MADNMVTVAVDDQRLAQIDDVATELRRQGMQVAQVHRVTGIIIGSVPDENLQRFEEVRGVKSVKSGRIFRIAPPEADVQ